MRQRYQQGKAGRELGSGDEPGERRVHKGTQSERVLCPSDKVSRQFRQYDRAAEQVGEVCTEVTLIRQVLAGQGELPLLGLPAYGHIVEGVRGQFDAVREAGECAVNVGHARTNS